MPRTHLFTSVSLSRWQDSRDTHATSDFTTQQLDNVAPLTTDDIVSLSTQSIPSDHARLMIERRIEIAHNLKYRDA